MKTKIPENPVDSLVLREDIDKLVQKEMDRAIANTVNVSLVCICNTNTLVFERVKSILHSVAPLRLDNPTLVNRIETDLAVMCRQLAALTEHMEKEKGALEAKDAVKH